MKRTLECYLKSKAIKNARINTQPVFIAKFKMNKINCPKNCFFYILCQVWGYEKDYSYKTENQVEKEKNKYKIRKSICKI